MHFESDNRFRTAPPASKCLGAAIIDSYTGFHWCATGLHLLTPENRTSSGNCKPCAARRQRIRRRAKGR